MNHLQIWNEESLTDVKQSTTLATRLARRQLQRFQQQIAKLRMSIDVDKKQRMHKDNNLETLLFTTQDFVETLIQCQEEQQKSPLLRNFHSSLQETVKQKNKLLETEEKFKALREIPETALSHMPIKLANIKLLQQLTHTVELANETLKISPEDLQIQRIIIENQQLLIWNLIQHISNLITSSKLGP